MSKNQEIIYKLVNREILYNVSEMITAISSNCPALAEQFENIQCKPDYEGAIAYYLQKADEVELDEILDLYGLSENIKSPRADKELTIYDHAMDAPDMFCADQRIDHGYVETLEYWLVTPWIGRELIKQGEMVVMARDNDLNMTVWGRTISGQAIIADEVIHDICSSMHILEGQENEWRI